MSVIDVVLTHGRTQPMSIAIADESTTVEYGLLASLILQVAGGLRARNLREGSVIALAMQPSAAYLTTMLGVIAAGYVACPVNTRLSSGEVSAYLSGVDAALLIQDEQSSECTTRVQLPTVTVETASPGGVGRGLAEVLGTEAELLDLEELAPAMIFPTGGTTGTPKGAIHTHRSLYLYCLAQAENGLRLSRDVDFSASPFFHVSVLSGPLTTLVMGARSVLQTQFQPEAMAAALTDLAITSVVGTPIHYEMLLGVRGFNGSPHLRQIVTGGANATPQLIQRLLAAFPNARLASGYGATELGLIALAHHEELVSGRITGVGRPAPMVDVRVVDDGFIDVPPGVAGQLLIRTPYQASGYCNRPEETASAWIGDHVAIGDVGWLSDDGWLTLQGRLKEMILSGGENIFPNEIETVLSRHPSVESLVAYGCPDPRWGERVEVAIVMREGARPVTLTDLRNFASDELARYKLPKRVRIVASIPRTPVDKVDRRLLAAQATAAAAREEKAGR